LEQRERGEAKDAASLMKPLGEDIILTVAGVEAGKTAYERWRRIPRGNRN